MFRLIFFVFFVAIACASEKPIDLHERVTEFDLKNGEAVKVICDSLIATMGRENSYLLVISMNEQEAYFKKVDSSRKIGNRFESSYLPSNLQVEYLRKIGINNLYYYNKAKIFFAYLPLFASGDSSITMYLYYGTKELSAKKTPFFSAGNRVYLLAKNAIPNERTKTKD